MKTPKQPVQDKPLQPPARKESPSDRAPGELLPEFRELAELSRQLDIARAAAAPQTAQKFDGLNPDLVIANPDPSKLPTGDKVKIARMAAGLQQKDAAEIFGYQIRGWQKKEESGNSHRQLTLGEWNFLLLLAGQHPEFQLVPKEISPVKD